MYPLVVILFSGLFPENKSVIRFSLPLAVIGLFISVYHNLLYYHILPESIAPCRSGVSCTTVQLQWLGFITIPLLSFTAFTLITSLLIVAWRKYSHER